MKVYNVADFLRLVGYKLWLMIYQYSDYKPVVIQFPHFKVVIEIEGKTFFLVPISILASMIIRVLCLYVTVLVAGLLLCVWEGMKSEILIIQNR
ncbi:hypothetical protein [Algivirga pacifica]|uniref:Uncharacterized protein n=1 Tax=Algivirga pacifica TaxID=1162670 RepID=A0ABP9DCC7_9BACT